VRAKESAIVLFSGGIDSTTALYWGQRHFSRLEALIFNYGQKHVIENRMAGKIARGLGIPFRIIDLPLKDLVSSALTDDDREIPDSLSGARNEIGVPVTYVPFRNGIFLSVAAACAESWGIYNIITGFNVIDSPDYPDTTRDFVEKMEMTINMGTSAMRSGSRFKIQVPLIDKTKAEIIEWGQKLAADYSFSISCYRGKEIPCMKCPSCEIRRDAFHQLDIPDPLIDRLEKEGKI
jgi:7-cyano-7-deazaguanine synthase